jgi:hypothetical protein
MIKKIDFFLYNRYNDRVCGEILCSAHAENRKVYAERM